ncbi:hypothetical protein D918_02646 [Trichuris suis]|nr:hypothetical protein D918_02646 [Trichuris suis]
MSEECHPEEAEIKCPCSPKSLDKAVELGNIETSKSANFASKMPLLNNAFKGPVSESKSNSEMPLSGTVDNELKKKIEANASLTCTGAFTKNRSANEGKVSLIQGPIQKKNKPALTRPLKGILKVSSQGSDTICQKNKKRKRVILIIDQGMETGRAEVEEKQTNVSLNSASADNSILL